MNHPSTLPIRIIAGALGGGLVGWVVVNAAIALDVGTADMSAFATLSARVSDSRGELLQVAALLFGFSTLGAMAVYAFSVQRTMGLQKELVEHANEADRSKNIFISMLLHFIRTPLAGIRWSLDTMRERTDLDVAGRHQIDALYEETLRALDAVEHLLDVSRASVGNMSFQFQDLPVTEVLATIEYAITDVRRQAEEKKITIKSERSVTTAKHMRVDRSKIQIAIQTLLENAINYTRPGGRISVTATETPTALRCEVTDTGIGIPRKDQDKVFMQFYRSENARRERPNGFGVGLYMIKMFIERHGGKIWFSSKEGIGSTFSFEVPYSSEPVPESSRLAKMIPGGK